MWFRYTNINGRDTYVNLAQCSVVRFDENRAVIWEAGIAECEQAPFTVREADDIQRLRDTLDKLI